MERSGQNGSKIAPTVIIYNQTGVLAIEVASHHRHFLSRSLQLREGVTSTGDFRTQQPTYPTGGAVVFTNNICQLERAAARGVSLASVVILTLDGIIFSNNQCWVDGEVAAFIDTRSCLGSHGAGHREPFPRNHTSTRRALLWSDNRDAQHYHAEYFHVLPAVLRAARGAGKPAQSLPGLTDGCRQWRDRSMRDLCGAGPRLAAGRTKKDTRRALNHKNDKQ